VARSQRRLTAMATPLTVTDMGPVTATPRRISFGYAANSYAPAYNYGYPAYGYGYGTGYGYPAYGYGYGTGYSYGTGYAYGGYAYHPVVRRQFFASRPFVGRRVYASVHGVRRYSH
jgi:hypothetical protein